MRGRGGRERLLAHSNQLHQARTRLRIHTMDLHLLLKKYFTSKKSLDYKRLVKRKCSIHLPERADAVTLNGGSRGSWNCGGRSWGVV